MPLPPQEPAPSSSISSTQDSDADILMGNSITGLLDGVTQRSSWNGSKTTWEPPSDEELKRLFPAFQIECVLGRGGMGIVYKARDTVMRKTVAIKLLPPLLAEDSQLMARFKREAHLMNSLDHPGIVKVDSFVQTPDGHAYFVMEYVEGKTIHELVQAKEITVRKALRLVVQVCKALHYLHGQGILHRDIKPSNIIVDGHGNARLLDFGIAGQVEKGTENLTLTGHNPGTPFYMAPELHKGDPPTTSSDIYALGVTFYEMLTGERPHIQATPPSKRSKADPSVDKVVFRALKPHPAARYQNADEMRKDIQSCSRASKEFRQGIVIAASLLAVTAITMAWLLRPEDTGNTPTTTLVAETLFESQPAQFEDTPPTEVRGDAPASKLPPSPVNPGQLTRTMPDKEDPFTNSLGMKFVSVPGTHVLFSIWETRVRDYVGFAKIQKLNDKWKNQMEHDLPVSRGDDDPIMWVSWLRAKTYCDWLTETETNAGILPKGAKYRLPTDLEWSAAVGLVDEQGNSPQERSEKNTNLYPWGSNFPPEDHQGNYRDSSFLKLVPKEPGIPIPGYTDGYAVTSPVGSFPPNNLGIYDLGGNVSEWCADRYAPGDNRLILRGGNYISSDPKKMLSSSREPFVGDDRFWRWFGFRCVLDVSGLHTDVQDALATAPKPVIPTQSLPYTASFEPPEFNSGAFGTGKALETQSSRWRLHAHGNGTDLPQLARVQTAVVKSGKQTLLIQAEYAKSATGGVLAFFENSASILNFEADIRLASSPSQTTWQFVISDHSASEGFVGGMKITADDGRFQLITSGSRETVPIIKRDTWYRLRLSFDVSKQTYQVSVNDSVVASEVPFLGRSEKLSGFQFDTLGTGDDLAYLDNFSISEGSRTSPAAPALQDFKSIVQGYEWTYSDSLYPLSKEDAVAGLRFDPNGKFHDRWNWNYWIAAPGILHVQYWDPVYKPETAVVLKFNEARTAYSGQFKDEKGRLHKLSGTRLDPIK